MVSVEALAAALRQKNDVGHEDVAALVEALASSGNLAFAPLLEAELERAVERDDFYARDQFATALAGLAKIDALPTLLTAVARAASDDKDSLEGLVVELFETDFVRARGIALEFASSQDDGRRAVGVWALGYLFEPTDSVRMREALMDRAAAVRASAAGALGSFSTLDQECVDEVGALCAALRDEDPSVRCNAVVALTFFQNESARAPLLALADDPHPQIRACLALALAYYRDESLAGAIEQLGGVRGMPASLGSNPAIARWALLGLPERLLGSDEQEDGDVS